MIPRRLAVSALFVSVLAAAFAQAPAGVSHPPFRITGVCHVGFWVRDIGKSREFYQTVLGFEEPYTLSRPNGDLFVAFVKVNDRQTINLYPNAAKILPDGDNLYHVGLETDNAAALHDYLVARGIGANAVHQTPLGDLIFAIKDPDGHPFEITQYGAAGRLRQNAGKNLPAERIANRLASVSLRVANREAALGFYRDLLGFKETARTGKGVTGTCLTVPDGSDAIILETNGPKAGAPPGRQVEQFSLEQTEGSQKKAHTMFFDPDGTRLEIVAPGYSGGRLAKIEPTRTLIYKRIGGRELTMAVFAPKGPSSAKLHPCFVAIHGGGWTSGEPRSMYSFAARAAELGMVGISLQYRLFKSAPGLTVYDCVKDGRSAIRYLRAHAVELEIDPDKIVVAGSSAGGHLAAADAVLDGIDEAGEDTSVSCIPNAVILMSAVIDTSPEGYGNAKAGPHWQELSPLLHVHPGLPPTLMFHGTGDLTTPFKGAQEFHDAMIAAGNRCELVAMPGASHTYYGKDQALYDRTMDQLVTFLVSLGYCKSPPPESTGRSAKANSGDYAAELAGTLEPTRKIVFKTVGDLELRLHVFDPAGPANAEKRPCLIAFHGGGWNANTPREMYAFAARAAALGWVGICPEYRLYRAGSVSVFEVVKDARSAVRYVRAHAAEWGIDPGKIVVSGASAGGHLAVATAMFDGLDESGEDTAVSCRPDALVLQYPVIDTSREGYGNAKIGERWRELSPADQVRPGMPPMILFHGTADTKTPFQGAATFHDAMVRAGNRCEFVVNQGGTHGYLRRNPAIYAETQRRTEAFLASLGIAPVAPDLPPVFVHGIKIVPANPPAGLKFRRQLGLVAVDALDGQVVYRTTTRVLETRAVVTPRGDYLLMFAEGEHYANAKGRHLNQMQAFRSSDHGLTWSGPKPAFAIDYNQHGFVPLIPRGSKRIFAFGTQPVPGKYDWRNGQQENAPIGYRWSDDDGFTWSEVRLIEPRNDPGFRGMSVTRMTETDAGTWLIGAHTKDASVNPSINRQYVLRSDDQGRTWTLLPGPRPGGWFAPGFNRMDEGRPINLGGGEVLFMARTAEGHLWSGRSLDDGQTWTQPAPTALVHPNAPPMIFHLSDGHSLIELLHNRTPDSEFPGLDTQAEAAKVRSEIWFALSTDGGRIWSEPRFLFANALPPAKDHPGWNYQCSYVDMFCDHGLLHFFVPYRWEEALHLTMEERSLADSPSLEQLGRTAADGPFALRRSGSKSEPLALAHPPEPL